MYLPCLPTVGGDEGVGDVVEIGDLVCTVTPGERVIINSRLLGSWRYYGIYHERDVHIVSPNLPLPEAAMLAIGPSSAYRMIKDFRVIKPGDTIIQNAANSPCGQCVIQLCKAWGINTLNIVPDICEYAAVKDYLMELGATKVVTLQEAERLTAFNTSLERPVLALNCLAGRCEDVLLKLLERYGTMIYYGDAFASQMEKQFLRCDVTFGRFHINDWDKRATCYEKDLMINEIIQLIVTGKFVAPLYQTMELKNYMYALKNTYDCEANNTLSYLFDFTLPQ